MENRSTHQTETRRLPPNTLAVLKPGTIPKELGNLAALRMMWLQHNSLEGPVPPELGDLTSLQLLYLWDNELTGHIPRQLGNLANLQHLVIGKNRLSGTIPEELGNLKALMVMFLQCNCLEGSMPPQVESIGELEQLCAWGNQLAGSIPPYLDILDDMERLSIERSRFYGAISRRPGVRFGATPPTWIIPSHLVSPDGRDRNGHVVLLSESLSPQPGNQRDRPLFRQEKKQQSGYLSPQPFSTPLGQDEKQQRSPYGALEAAYRYPYGAPPYGYLSSHGDGVGHQVPNSPAISTSTESGPNSHPRGMENILSRVIRRREDNGKFPQQMSNSSAGSKSEESGGTSTKERDDWPDRLEPYNNISVIATLLAGFGLAIFPFPRSDVPEGHDFLLGLTGHVVYNFLMCCSFGTNMLVAVVLALQLYFTQRLATLHSPAVASRFMKSTLGIRHFAVCGFSFFSFPVFMIAFTILLFAVLEEAAAICTSVVTLVGLGLAAGSTLYYFREFGNAVQGCNNHGGA
ncbi:unnamed protein product [Ectocarpus sp. 4 AP-2014]